VPRRARRGREGDAPEPPNTPRGRPEKVSGPVGAVVGGPDARDGSSLLADVLERTQADVESARVKAAGKGKKFKRELTFAIRFAKYTSAGLARALQPEFPGTVGGEQPSRAARGTKRLDVRYSTPEAGLGLAVSLKSVHFGERDGGNAGFTHNLKRNDEELRVEATGHHLRQPYSVLAAVIFLPLESCEDKDLEGEGTSSFASWVRYLWPLKGRDEPEDPPDQYELVFVALYSRNARELGFYEVGGPVPCPRRGRPQSLIAFSEFLDRLTETYRIRNGEDFHFAGED
jgi:hypothetical protein